MIIRRAKPTDAPTIEHVLTANRADPSLFQQPLRRIRRQINDFVVAESGGEIVGCAALHWHRADNVEILAFAVLPEHHGAGIGKALMTACLEVTDGSGTVWLSTRKPGYFDRFGFRSVSMWSMPLTVLLTKVRLIFEQPLRRWLTAVTRSQFMRLA